MGMCAIEDEETQRRGSVVVVVAGDRTNQNVMDVRTVVAGPWLRRATPMKMVALHHCFFNDVAARVTVNLMLRFLDKRDRARCKMHSGKKANRSLDVLSTIAVLRYLLPTKQAR